MYVYYILLYGMCCIQNTIRLIVFFNLFLNVFEITYVGIKRITLPTNVSVIAIRTVLFKPVKG